jgi:hypothetical protein
MQFCTSRIVQLDGRSGSRFRSSSEVSTQVERTEMRGNKSSLYNAGCIHVTTPNRSYSMRHCIK